MIKVKERYARRPDRHGWTVYDIWTGEPVSLALWVQTGLTQEDAEDLVRAMNRKAADGDRRIWQ